MKKIVVLLLFLICLQFAYGQTVNNPTFLPPRSSSATTVQDSRWRALMTAYMPHTHGLTLNGGLDTLGAYIYDDSSQHVWYRDTIISGGHKWSMILKTGDAGNGTVKRITLGYGLLPFGLNLTDTGTAIIDTAGLSNFWIRRHDSLIVFVTPTQMNSQGFLKTIAGIAASGDLAGFYPNPTIALNAVTFAKFQQLPGFTFAANPTASPSNLQASYFGYGLRWNNDSIKVDTGLLKLVFGGGGGGGGGITQITGDVLVGPGTGTQGAILKTVNSDIFGSNTFLKFSVNAKGLVPSAATVGPSDITGALGYVPGLFNSNVGAGYRLAFPNTNNVRSLFCVGCSLDSTANANGITLTVTAAGNPNSNIGSGFRLAVPNTNNVKTVFVLNGIAADSSSNTNAVTIQVDTSRMIHAVYAGIRNRNPDFSLEQIYMDDPYKNGVFYYDNTDVSTVDDSCMTFVTPSGKRWKRVVSLPGYVNAQWFGAIGDGSDQTYQLQKAINWCVKNPNISQTVYFPAGAYAISSPLLIANFDGTAFHQVTVNLLGQTPQKNKSAGNVVIQANFNQTFAIGMQQAKSIFIRNINIVGQYTRATTFTAIQVDTLKKASWWDGSCRNNTVSPYAGIAIDFASDTTTGMPAGSVYPGLGAYYVTGLSRAGSTDILIDNCHIQQFWVGIIVTPSDQQNGDIINIWDCQVGSNFVGIANTQAQTKDMRIKNFMVWSAEYSVFDNVTFGTRHADGGGVMNVDGGNTAGAVNNLVQVTASNFRMSFNNIYSESLFKIGNAFGTSGVEFNNSDFNLAMTDVNIPYPDFILQGDNVTANDCQIRFYGQPNSRSLFAGANIKFTGGILSGAPVITNVVTANNSNNKPTFDHVAQYGGDPAGPGLLGGSAKSQYVQSLSENIVFNRPIYPGTQKVMTYNNGNEYTFTYKGDWERSKFIGSYPITTDATFHGKFYAGPVIAHFLRPNDVLLTSGTSYQEGQTLTTYPLGIVDSVNLTNDTCYVRNIAVGITNGTTYSLTVSWAAMMGPQFMGTLATNDNKITQVRLPAGYSVAGGFVPGTRIDMNPFIPGCYVDSTHSDTVWFSYASQTTTADSGGTYRRTFMNGYPDIEIRSKSAPEKGIANGATLYNNSLYYYEPKNFKSSDASTSSIFSNSAAEVYRITSPLYNNDTSVDKIRYDVIFSKSRGQSISIGTTAQNVGVYGGTKPLIKVNVDSVFNGLTHATVTVNNVEHMLAYYDEAITIPGNGYLKVVSGSVTNLTPTQVTADLNIFASGLKGLVPNPGVPSGQILSDGGWVPASSLGATLYNGDGALTLNAIPFNGVNGRVIAGANGYIKWDSTKYIRWLGGTGLSSLTLDLSVNNTLLFSGSSGSTFRFNNSIVDSNLLTTLGAGTNRFAGNLVVGSSSAALLTSNVATFVSTTFGYVGMQTTSTTGSSAFLLYTPTSGSSIGGVIVQAASGTPQASLPNNGILLYNSFGYLNLGAFASNGKIPIFVGGVGYPNEVGRFATGLFQLGDTAAHADAQFAMTSTTKGFLPMRMTLAQFTAISSPTAGLHAVLTDSSYRLALWNGTKYVTYATTDMLGSGGSQTWQQSLTTGSTLTGTNTVTNTGHDFIFNNGGTGTFKFNGILSDTTNAAYLLAKKKDSSVFEMPFSAIAQYMPADTLTGGQAIQITQLRPTNFTVNLGGTITVNDTVSIATGKTILWNNSGTIFDNSTFLVNTSSFQVNGSYAFGGWSLTTSTGTVTITMSSMTQGGGQLIDPPSVITSLTFNFPATANVVDGYVLNVHYGGQVATGGAVVTTETWTPNSGQSLVGVAPTSQISGDYVSWKFYAASQRWYREH